MTDTEGSFTNTKHYIYWELTFIRKVTVQKTNKAKETNLTQFWASLLL